MTEFVADLHLHSRYSRACSRELSVSELAKWAKLKGIGVLGTGDFTHPLWGQELKEALREAGHGLYEHAGVLFMLTVEVNTLFYVAGRCHQIHHVLMAPSFQAVDRINQELEAFGNLGSDGRPTLSMEAWRLVEIVRGADPRCVVVPAHAWTPHFSVFGSNSGFDTIEECFQHQAQHIFALETGLSSDPAMNWRLSALDRYALISNSDSHSARRIGREANVFAGEPSYDGIMDALRTRDPAKFLYTLEFFPEEGKYHYDGHRNCGVRWAPEEARRHQLICSKCGRKVTVGVMHRIDKLADRPEGATPTNPIPFKRTVPLDEIIAEAMGQGVGTLGVDREYQALVYKCGTELDVLLKVPEEDLRRHASAKIAEGILRIRQGRVHIEPGYDGEYGKVHIFHEAEAAAAAAGEQQMTLF